jgi:uncharacterized RDD family membrane protein YckC
MAFLGIEPAKAPAGIRQRRFVAFAADTVFILLLILLLYSLTGEPDFYRVRTAMDAAAAAGGQDAALTSEVFTQFNRAYGMMLIVWFVYEAASTLAFSGSTPGKLLAGLQVVPARPGRPRILNIMLLIMRAAIKALSLYLFQGFPFLICSLTTLTNPECRSGFDMAAKTLVVLRHRSSAESKGGTGI